MKELKSSKREQPKGKGQRMGYYCKFNPAQRRLRFSLWRGWIGAEYHFPCTMSGSVESQKHMFLIRTSHCLHVVTMSPSAHPNILRVRPSDGGQQACRGRRRWNVAGRTLAPALTHAMTPATHFFSGDRSHRSMWGSVQLRASTCFTVISVTSVIFSCKSSEDTCAALAPG